MNRSTRTLPAGLVLALAFLLAACSSGSSSDDGGDKGDGEVTSGSSGSCALRVEYASVVYTDIAEMPMKAGKLLGTGSQLGCDDTGSGASEDTDVNVYAVDGLDTKIAVAVGSSPDDAQLLAPEGDVPDEVQKFLEAHQD